MNQGFVRAAAATPKGKVADVFYNEGEIARIARELAAEKVKLAVFPELCITGYTCSDLFLQTALLDGAKAALAKLCEDTKDLDMLLFAGLPLEHRGSLYNVAAAIKGGKVLGLIPKSFIPDYSEFYEGRYFTAGKRAAEWISFNGQQVPFGTDLLFTCEKLPELVVAGEICEDLWVPNPPSIRHGLAGATVVVNLSASNEIVGKDAYRKNLIKGQSARLICGYVYADAGEGESTTDLVFGAHNIITENGTLLAESKRFRNEAVFADIDLQRIRSERRRQTSYLYKDTTGYTFVPFDLEMENGTLKRQIDNAPFVPKGEAARRDCCEEILTIQAMGLKKRLEHTFCKSAVVGISGGLDSTLALLVVARAFDLLEIPRENILSVTMPCFGTTDRTYQNAIKLTKALGATLKEVNIKAAVTQHFEDIGHDPSVTDVTFENSQARERTQVLMDLANRTNGMVIGTGDLSELVLGWATYNGDHMSMYGVNASIPKTLVRHLVQYYAESCADEELSHVLLDVLATPVSPELLPPKDGEIAQKTEDLVGAYELHDFFLFYMLRYGFTPGRIYYMARHAFAGEYDDATILKWLKTFYHRFFSQQFKRSCLPDG